jgi:TRAP-type C4-dicarboxylate transport system substrate-binding protein
MNVRSICGALALLLSATETSVAQTKLRIADSLPTNHFFVEQATKVWMEEVSRQTNGAVTFEYYPSEQLGKAKDLLSLTQSGVVDIGYVVPSYVSEKMPLSAVAELPGTFGSSCQGTLAYWKMARGSGILAQREYEPNGVKVLFAVVMPPYQIFLQKRIESLKSFEGQKLRTTGGSQDAVITRLKAVSVHITAPELHDSLSRGTVDGMVFPTASTLAYDVAGLVKASTSGENFGSAVLTYMISNARWNTLTSGAQHAMLEAGDRTVQQICAYADHEVENDLAKIRSKGVATAPLPAEDKPALAAMTADISKEWAEALDKRGKPGSDVLRAFSEALK